MSAVSQPIGKTFVKLGETAGVVKKVDPQPQAAAPQPAARPGVDVPAQGRDEAAEALAARRRARRGGRALLSEARLNPESGVQTLGSSGML
jgi:hypothetical protein